MVRNNKNKQILVRNVAIKPKKQAKKKKKEKEMTLLGGILRGLGGLGGGAIGGMAGFGPAGSALGTAAGGQLSKWLGSGDYTVSKNSLVLKGSDSVPMMHNNGQSIVVRHKEYITDILSTTVFGIYDTFPLNPGLRTTFPWLSTVAQNFVEYTWHGVVYHFVPTSGASVASTNTALGSVMMATNYRATAPNYPNKQVMLNEFFASDARPTEPFIHPIECDPKENPYNVQYVRSGPVPVGEDQKTYDLGVTTVATQGMPSSGNVVGELWVSYEVELRKPKAVGLLQNDSLFFGETRTVCSVGNPFGTTAGTPSSTDVVVTGQTITVAKELTGRFILIVTYPAASITASVSINTSVTGGTLVSNKLGLAASTMTATGNWLPNWYVYESTDPTTSMVISASTLPFTGSVANVIIRLYQVNSAST